MMKDFEAFSKVFCEGEGGGVNSLKTNFKSNGKTSTFYFYIAIFLYSITGKTMNGFDFLKKLLTILLTNLHCKSKRLGRLRP